MGFMRPLGRIRLFEIGPTTLDADIDELEPGDGSIYVLVYKALHRVQSYKSYHFTYAITSLYNQNQ